MPRGLGRSAASLLALAALGCAHQPAARARPGGFVAVVLGASGGLDEGDLTSILLAPEGSADFVALDAGTLTHGERVAGGGLLAHVPAILVSHAHLDHLAGLVIHSAERKDKATVLGLAPALDALRDHLFNWTIWANFTDEGVAPRLGLFHLARLAPGVATHLDRPALDVTALPLSHGSAHGEPVTSTAFLVRSPTAAALYLGDTGPDAVEGGERLLEVWRVAAPLVRAGTLRAIFIECSYPDGRPDHKLYGHLTPAHLVAELGRLAALVDAAAPERALGDVTVVVTHIKPALDGSDTRGRIAAELAARNRLGLRLIVPRQGQRLAF